MPDLRSQSWSMETDCVLTRSPGDLYAHYCLRSSARKFIANQVLSYKLYFWRGRGNWGFEVSEWLTTEGHLAGTGNLLPSTGLELFSLDYFVSWWQSKGNNGGNGRFHWALNPRHALLWVSLALQERGLYLSRFSASWVVKHQKHPVYSRLCWSLDFPVVTGKLQKNREWHIDGKRAVWCWTSSLTSHDSSKKWDWTTWPSGQFPVLKFEDSKSSPRYILISFLLSSSDLGSEMICSDQRWRMWVGGRAIFYSNGTAGKLHPNPVPAWLASLSPSCCAVSWDNFQVVWLSYKAFWEWLKNPPCSYTTPFQIQLARGYL